MVQWQVWIIPLIGVAVWIIGHLLSNKEQEQRKNQARRQPGDRENPQAGQQPPLTDLDRFLREVNRRRQTAADRKPQPIQVVPLETPKPQPPRPSRQAQPARSVQTPRTKQTKTAAPAPREMSARSARRNDLPVVLPVGADKYADQAPLTDSQPAALAFPVAFQVATIAAEAATARVAATAKLAKMAGDKEAVSPVMSNVWKLISSGQNLQTAMVLQEIFAKPVCMRGR